MARTVNEAAHEARRNAILEAAESAIATRGYEQMAIADHLTSLPRWLLLPLLNWYISREKKALSPNDIPMEALIPTQRFDGLLVKEMDGRLETFAHLPAEVLLLGGAKSPAFLREVLDALTQTLPQVKRIEYLDHSGPTDQSRPHKKGSELIAGDLRAIFRQTSWQARRPRNERRDDSLRKHVSQDCATRWL